MMYFRKMLYLPYLIAVLKSSNQKEKLITTLGKGDIFAEMAIVDGKPRSASIKTLTKTKLGLV